LKKIIVKVKLVFKKEIVMRKYLKVNIVSGLVEDLSIDEFNNLYNENLNRVENDNGLISYIGKDFILVDDSVIDYDE
jgi:hypothetical protein